MTSETASSLEAEAANLLKRAAEIRTERQTTCQHPLAELTFTEGAVRSHCAAYDDQQVYVRCGFCDALVTKTVRIHHGDY